MLTESEITDRFRPKGTKRGEELFLSLSHAVALLELCDRNSIAIIGIEGFFLRDGDLHPRLDEIADYSSAVADAWDSFVRICNDSAQAFLQSLCSDSEVVSESEVVVTVTTLSQANWRERSERGSERDQ